MSNWVKKFGGWFPLLIVLVSVTQKAYYLKTFASSEDDNLVASSIIYGKMPFNETKFRTTINDTIKPTYHSLPKIYARKLDSAGYLMPILRQGHFLFPLYAVPNETTYAPLQFFLTAFLVRDSQSLFTNIFMGRLPSLLVHFLGLLLFLYLMVKYFSGSENLGALCFALLVLSFSHEHVMYSFQMESYAIGVFGVLLLLLGYLTYMDKKMLNEKSSFISIGFFCALLMLMQYQLLFFSFAAVSSIIYFSFLAKVSLRVIAKRMIFSGATFLLFFLPTYFMFLSKHTEHIAKNLIGGSAQLAKYWFPAHIATDWKDGLIYFFSFFSSNFLDVFRSMTFLFTPFSIAETIFFGINLTLFIIGFISTIKNRNDLFLKWIKVFLFFSALVWMALLISGRIALTPDRHSLILLPIFVFFIYFGGVKITDFLTRNKMPSKQIGSVVIIIALLTFLYSTNDFLSKRVEPLYLAGFNEESIPSKSLIVTNDRVFYLFSREKGIPIFLDTKDMSRRGWLRPLGDVNYLPERIYFVMNNPEKSWLVGENFKRKYFDLFSYKLNNEKYFKEDYLSESFQTEYDTTFSVKDDEVNPAFEKQRDIRIIAFRKNNQ